MPVKRALRTLTTLLDVAVFLWRRYGTPVASPPAVATPQAAIPLERKRAVAVDAVSDEAEATEPTRTVRFGLDGQQYEIDLRDEDAAQLREAFARYVAAGRRVRPQAGTASTSRARGRTTERTTAGSREAAAIREWARANGHQVSDRGPIPATVRQAYEARGRRRR